MCNYLCFDSALYKRVPANGINSVPCPPPYNGINDIFSIFGFLLVRIFDLCDLFLR